MHDARVALAPLGMPDSSVRAVLRTARVLKAFSDGQAEFGVNQLARHLALSPATVHRILNTLVAEGFIEQDSVTGRYHLGPEALFLGLACLNSRHLGSECIPIMRDLSTQTGESVNLGILRGKSVIYVHQVESPQPLRFARDVGTSIPLHSTALGKLLLAFLPEPRQQDLLASLDLVCHTPATITDRAELRRHLRTVRERGYAITDEEYISDLRGLAVPVRDYSGEVIAGLSVMGPSSRLTLKRLEAFLPDLLDAAARLSRQLGWR
jgi:DNA-binding IclR family transcriptional regulator